MTESDDPVTIGLGVASFFVAQDQAKKNAPGDIAINPERTIETDPDVLDPQQKKKKDRLRASQTVLTEDFAAPVLGNQGVLGLTG